MVEIGIILLKFINNLRNTVRKQPKLCMISKRRKSVRDVTIPSAPGSVPVT